MVPRDFKSKAEVGQQALRKSMTGAGFGSTGNNTYLAIAPHRVSQQTVWRYGGTFSGGRTDDLAYVHPVGARFCLAK